MLVVRLLPFSVGSSMPSVQICVPVLCSLGGNPHSINISSGAASCGPHILKFCEVTFASEFEQILASNLINLTEYKLIIAPKLPMTSLGFGRHSNT